MEGPTTPRPPADGSRTPRRRPDPEDPKGSGPHPPPVPPTPGIPEAVLRAFGARVLDPLTAVTAPGLAPPQPTAYIGSTLLVRGLPDAGLGGHAAVEEIKGLAEEMGLVADVSEGDAALRRLADDDELEVLDQVWQTQVVLRRQTRDEAMASAARRAEARGEDPPREPPAAPPPDAWRVLQALATRRGSRPEDVALEHLLLSAGGFQPAGQWGSVGEWGSVGQWGSVGAADQYGVPGLGGRTPVVRLGEDPYRPAAGKRAPVVAVLDTAVGPHPWFTEEKGVTTLSLPGRPLVAAGQGLTVELDGLLAGEAGHGTFVAGIIRQRCPEAQILVLPVVPFAGAAAEKDVHDALALLLARQLWATRTGRHDALVDVINLSLGYYHETPEDAWTQDPPLKRLLGLLADAGVAVVAAAGNDGTSAKFYPAGFALERTAAIGSQKYVPLVSVGAYNPGDSTVALFSNSGLWVTTHRPGAAVVSTVPTTMRGSMQAGVLTQRNDPTDRALIDPDDFSTGFASWSGTSFAAPVLAAEIAAALPTDETLCDTDTDACVARAKQAVATALAATS